MEKVEEAIAGPAPVACQGDTGPEGGVVSLLLAEVLLAGALAWAAWGQPAAWAAWVVGCPQTGFPRPGKLHLMCCSCAVHFPFDVCWDCWDLDLHETVCSAG